MKNKGFSLVELIVVIAIMAILVGVAVPVYTSYIEKASISSDKQMVGEVVRSIEIANAMAPFKGSAAIILSKDGVTVNGVDADKAWVEKVLGDTFGEKYYEELKLKYNGWGNGAAAARVMLNALNPDNFADGSARRELADAMQAIFGDANNLTFTEEMPELLETVKDVAIEITKEDGQQAPDDMIVNTVGTAAALTSGVSHDDFQTLWFSGIKHYSYGGNKCTYETDTGINTEEQDGKLAVAGVVRAKNTCLATYGRTKNPELFAKYPGLYDALSGYIVPGRNTMPADLQFEVGHIYDDGTSGEALIAATLADKLGLTDPDEITALMNQLGGLLTEYQASSARANDATAYLAMMNVVNDMDGTLDGSSLDEYFNSATGTIKLLQQLVAGTIKFGALNNALSGTTAGDNNVTISIVGDGQDLVIVVGPTSVLE